MRPNKRYHWLRTPLFKMHEARKDELPSYPQAYSMIWTLFPTARPFE